MLKLPLNGLLLLQGIIWTFLNASIDFQHKWGSVKVPKATNYAQGPEEIMYFSTLWGHNSVKFVRNLFILSEEIPNNKFYWRTKVPLDLILFLGGTASPNMDPKLA